MILIKKLIIIAGVILPLIVSIYQLHSYKYYEEYLSEKTRKKIEFSKKLNWITIIICCLTIIIYCLKLILMLIK